MSLGALEGVNYKEESFSKKFSNVDFILDCVGGSYWKDNMKVLAQDGKIILYGLLGGVKVEGPLLGMMLAKEGFQNDACSMALSANQIKPGECLSGRKLAQIISLKTHLSVLK